MEDISYFLIYSGSAGQGATRQNARLCRWCPRIKGTPSCIYIYIHIICIWGSLVGVVPQFAGAIRHLLAVPNTQISCPNHFLYEFGFVRHGMAWPGAARCRHGARGRPPRSPGGGRPHRLGPPSPPPPWGPGGGKGTGRGEMSSSINSANME